MIRMLIIVLLAYSLLSSDLLSQTHIATSQPQKKIALVIGNGNYQSSSVLANPENDARAMKVALQNVGFTVMLFENLRQSQMKKAIDDFGAKLKGNDVGLFFYAGHGIQSKGYNYLLPVDAELKSEQQVEYDCVQADRVLALMEASGSKVNILVLDACRNNPFERSWTRSETGKGLAFMNAPSGTLIAYATSPGSTASDGYGENGLYTSAILESMKIPNITIIQMFQNVRSIVSQKSNKQQIPWESTSLTGDFYINPRDVVSSIIQDNIQENPLVALPAISVLEISNISSTEARTNVTIINDGGSSVIERGVCWNITNEPSTSNSKIQSGIGIGNFSNNIIGLSPGKTYYIRAYATNSVGTQYSNQISLTTVPSKPTISTVKVSSNTATTAVVRGSISSDGGAPVTARGVCWSTSGSPTILNNKTLNGSGIGEYISNITGLLPQKTYYIRAFSTNYVGTNYGPELIFNSLTLEQFADIDANIYNTGTIGNQIWMLENLKTTKYNDGTPIPLISDKTKWSNSKLPGYCWYNNDETINKENYGALYNWYAVNTGNLCPTGWHIPSDAEWKTLTFLLGKRDVSGGKTNESVKTNLETQNKNVTSENSFIAHPGGYRFYNGEFNFVDRKVYYWSSTENSTCDVWNQYMNSNEKRLFSHKTDGFSVRCIKD